MSRRFKTGEFVWPIMRLWSRSQSAGEYPADWDDRRRRVYKRDDYTCQACGRRGGPYGDVELHADHVIPKSEGGSHDESNLQTLCRRCHDQKTRREHGIGLDGIARERRARRHREWIQRLRTLIRLLVLLLKSPMRLVRVGGRFLGYVLLLITLGALVYLIGAGVFQILF